MSESQLEKYSPEKIAHNNNVVYFCRICISTIGGCAAGILGVTGIIGFLCYFLTYAVISAFLLLKMNFRTDTYFTSSTNWILEGLFQGLLSYVMFWTLLYDIVHIY